MKKIKHWIRRYFSFTLRETNGFILLLLITVLAIAAPLLFEQFSGSATYDPTQDKLALDSLAAELERVAPPDNYTNKNRLSAEAKPPVRLHAFNPNTITQEELISLGVSRYAAGNIVKYRAKAGGFRYKEQLKRIYGLPEEQYLLLYPYIDLPAQKNNFSNLNKPGFTEKRDLDNRPVYKANRPAYALQPFDINTADTTQLKKIRGIGSKLSARIIKFRDKLGGFAHAKQLTEVYGLAPEVIDSLNKYTFVPEGYEPQKLNINSASLEQMRNHPYVGYNLGRLIVAYRTQHGAFRTTEDLKNIKLVTEELYQKLRPYLSI